MRPEARFHDGSKLTAQDVAFSLDDPEGEGPSADHPATARHGEGRGRRRCHRRRDLRREARARRAALRRGPADLLQGLLRQPRLRRIHARRAARLGALQGRQVRGQSLHRVRSREGLVGGRSAGQSRQLSISIRCVTSSIAIATSPSKASPPRTICSARSSPRGSGRRATTFRRSRTAGSSAKSLPDETPSGAQGWFINTRRDKFKDPRVREALIYAFDFEWTNKTIMYGAYARTHSPFQNSDMMAKGPPSPDEVKLLEPFRGQVPDEVFGEPFVPPVSDGSGQDRNMLRKATQLLQDAGLADQGRQAAAAERRGADHRVPDRRAVAAAASRRPTSRISRCSASTPTSAWSTPCNTGRGWRISTST